MNVKRSLIYGAALASSLVLAACGSNDSESPARSSSSAGGDTVAVQSVDGVGDVLVDQNGMALYASDLEAGGKVKCVGPCESFWRPLTVGSMTPKAAPGVGKLDLTKRPDGSRQVTVDGKLLYTFSEDSAGQVKGIGFEDEFQGRHFTWSAVLAGGELASQAGGDSPGGGYGY